MTADQCRPRVAHGHLLRADPARDVLGDGQALEGHPSWEEDVDDHQGLVRGGMDENVVGCLVRPVVGQFEQLAADLQDIPVLEGHRRRRPVRVIVAQQQPAGPGLPDADHVGAEEGGRADVVSVGMGVHHVGYRAGHSVRAGDGLDRAQQVVADGGRGVDEDHAVAGGQEHGLIERVGHPVEGVGDRPDEVAVGVEGGPERRRRYRGIARWGTSGGCAGAGRRGGPEDSERGWRGDGRRRASQEGAPVRRRTAVR